MELVAAIPPYSARTAGLHDRRDWLLADKITTVALNSTGNYWLCACAIMEGVGIAVWLVNARHVKGVPGKQTDVGAAAGLGKRRLESLYVVSYKLVADDVRRRRPAFSVRSASSRRRLRSPTDGNCPMPGGGRRFPAAHRHTPFAKPP